MKKRILILMTILMFLFSINVKAQNNNDNLMTSISIKTESENIDLRDSYMPDIYQQGLLGNCTTNAVLATLEYEYNKINKLNINDYRKLNGSISRLYSYYMSRKMVTLERKIAYNSIIDYTQFDYGSSLSEIYKSTILYGTQKESEIPYIVSNFRISPTIDEINDGVTNGIKFKSFHEVTSKQEILDNLNLGIPVAISTNISRFKDVDSKGLSKMSLLWTEQSYPATHSMVIVGRLVDFDYYGVKMTVYVLRNSWGKKWGDNGVCYINEDLMWKYNILDAYVGIY